MEERNRRALVIGTILIVLGLGFLAAEFIEPKIGQSLILFVIGAAFLVGYFIRRAYGLLIPGCILIGIGLGSSGLESAFGLGEFSEIGLGVGFVAIYVIDLLYRGSTHWWPLIPGGILIIVGLGRIPSLATFLERGWPILLVLVGLLLLAGAFGLFGRKRISP